MTDETMEQDPQIARLFERAAAELSQRVRGQVQSVARRVFGVPTETFGPVRPGEELGLYRIERLLGAGGQAWVYEARHAQLDRRVAIKIPRSDRVGRLLKEGRVGARIEHPRIVRVEDIRSDRGIDYLVLEFCPGGNLDERIERSAGGLPLPEVRTIALAILDGLEAAHARGVVHRDLKPANVLFDAHGEANIGDLGLGVLSVVESADTERLSAADGLSMTTGVVAGTPLFIAPEQENPLRLAGKPLDGRADLFSFGKVLFSMLTGADPRTIRPPSRIRPELDSRWDNLVFDLLKEDREKRPRDVAAVRQRIRGIGHAQVRAPAPTPEPEAPVGSAAAAGITSPFLRDVAYLGGTLVGGVRSRLSPLLEWVAVTVLSFAAFGVAVTKSKDRSHIELGYGLALIVGVAAVVVGVLSVRWPKRTLRDTLLRLLCLGLIAGSLGAVAEESDRAAESSSPRHVHQALSYGVVSALAIGVGIWPVIGKPFPRRANLWRVAAAIWLVSFALPWFQVLIARPIGDQFFLVTRVQAGLLLSLPAGVELLVCLVAGAPKRRIHAFFVWATLGVLTLAAVAAVRSSDPVHLYIGATSEHAIELFGGLVPVAAAYAVMGLSILFDRRPAAGPTMPPPEPGGPSA